MAHWQALTDVGASPGSIWRASPKSVVSFCVCNTHAMREVTEEGPAPLPSPRPPAQVKRGGPARPHVRTADARRAIHVQQHVGGLQMRHFFF